jgi:histidine triad (HIT) family protein
VSDCLFCKIARGEIPAAKVDDDRELFVIRDINPQAPVHMLIIPHRHIETISQFGADDEPLIGRIYRKAADLARAQGFEASGYRVVANCNRDAGQTVYHVHFHLLAGRPMGWPPG